MDTVVIDSGGANLASLQFALERLGAQVRITSNPREISSAPRVILPGVGAAADSMHRLQDSGLASLIPSLEQPVLGICLGMQLMFKHSEESDTPCLGILPQKVIRLQPQAERPVPHMGWNQLGVLRSDPLLEGILENDYVYFVHSYAVAVCEATLATTDYGGPLSAIVRQNNFWGMQFHPERSAQVGAKLLSNFMRIR